MRNQDTYQWILGVWHTISGPPASLDLLKGFSMGILPIVSGKIPLWIHVVSQPRLFEPLPALLFQPIDLPYSLREATFGFISLSGVTHWASQKRRMRRFQGFIS